LNYTKVDVDSVNERIAGPALDRGDLDSMDRDWLIGSVEVLFGWMVSEQLSFNAALGWHYDFNNSNSTLSGVDGGGPGQVTTPDVGESVFKVGLGADYAINANWSLGANASYLTGDNLSAYTLGLGLGYRF
jgi:outer membrane autotransporter protein